MLSIPVQVVSPLLVSCPVDCRDPERDKRILTLTCHFTGILTARSAPSAVPELTAELLSRYKECRPRARARSPPWGVCLNGHVCAYAEVSLLLCLILFALYLCLCMTVFSSARVPVLRNV
ncbi:hypothetical protein GN956_G5072 [Arapaima gigas]